MVVEGLDASNRVGVVLFVNDDLVFAFLKMLSPPDLPSRCSTINLWSSRKPFVKLLRLKCQAMNCMTHRESVGFFRRQRRRIVNVSHLEFHWILSQAG
jgi:hypothetical protein